jgi:hypothetical protein
VLLMHMTHIFPFLQSDDVPLSQQSSSVLQLSLNAAQLLHFLLLILMPAQTPLQQSFFTEHIVPISIHMNPEGFAVIVGELVGSSVTRYGGIAGQAVGDAEGTSESVGDNVGSRVVVGADVAVGRPVGL